MWDNVTPLKLLETMPENLEEDDLVKLQLLLEADRYKNQIIAGTDLCGTYAPICEGCNKEGKHPCAVAYLNYIKGQGANTEVGDTEQTVEESAEPSSEIENIEEQPTASGNPEEQLSTADEVKEGVEDEESKPEENAGAPEQEPQKTRIRIAIARKKTI